MDLFASVGRECPGGAFAHPLQGHAPQQVLRLHIVVAATGADAGRQLPVEAGKIARLAQAFIARGRHVAALGCLREAMSAGVPERDLADPLRAVEAALGSALTAWKATLVAS